MKKIWGIILFFGLIAIAIYKFSTPPSLDFKEIELVDSLGKRVSLDAYKGKPLVINFWATWCGPCMQEIPDFEQVQAKYVDSVLFLMVYDESSLGNIQGFFKKYNYQLTFLQSQKGFKQMGIYSIPTTYFLDKNGDVVDSKTGSLDVQSLENMILKIKK
jgi:thiol-disulfide isomerase/thioredoxin